MDGPDTAPPTVMSATGRPIDLRWRTDAAISRPCIIVKQIGVQPENLGTSWFGFLSLIID